MLEAFTGDSERALEFLGGIVYDTVVDPIQVVVDTNVVFSGLRSSRGASYRLLGLVGRSPKFEINISVPLILEYEDVLRRQPRSLGLTQKDVGAVLDYFCRVGNRREIFFLWRPLLNDANDDFILELAVESESRYIITFNERDFSGSEKFGVGVITPRDFLHTIKEL